MQEAGLHRPSFKAASKLNDGQTALGLTCALWVRQQASKVVVQEPTRGQMEKQSRHMLDAAVQGSLTPLSYISRGPKPLMEPSNTERMSTALPGSTDPC